MCDMVEVSFIKLNNFFPIFTHTCTLGSYQKFPEKRGNEVGVRPGQYKKVTNDV